MLTPSIAADVRVAWADISNGVPLFVVRKNGEYLCEGPYDRMDIESHEADDDTESSIRLFTEPDDCQRYCDVWRRLLGDEPNRVDEQVLRIVRVTLMDIWKHLGSIVMNSYIEYKTPPRIELCRLNPAGNPIVLDTLFTEREEMN